MIAEYLDEQDQQLLIEFRESNLNAQHIVDVVCRVLAALEREDCARYMRHIPRDYERAADAAAKAEAFEQLPDRLLKG